MGRDECDGWVRTLDGQRVLCTGTTRVGVEHWKRPDLQDAIRAVGGRPISGTRNALVTLLVQGDLTAARVTDPVGVRSKNAVYVDEQRRRGNHICIVDDAGITSLLLGDEPARCLRSQVTGPGRVELSAPQDEPDGAEVVTVVHDDDFAFMLTSNPDRWDWAEHDQDDAIATTARGETYETDWSTGPRTKLIDLGERAFLLRQGQQGRGLVASGRFQTAVYQAEHWNGSGELGNYADVAWDTVLAPADALPTEELQAALPEQDWAPQSSGTQVRAPVLPRLEELWRDHLAALGRTPARWTSKPVQPGMPIPRGGGQGRRLDQLLKDELEDEGQLRLVGHFEDGDWTVTDTHIGNPYDAIATKEGRTLYLEAKGTTTTGLTVMVSRREVEHAREHPGDCVLGVVWGIEVQDGHIVPGSGRLRIIDPWLPADQDLKVRGYDYRLPAED